MSSIVRSRSVTSILYAKNSLIRLLCNEAKKSEGNPYDANKKSILKQPVLTATLIMATTKTDRYG